jgi:hypothetical protein
MKHIYIYNLLDRIEHSMTFCVQVCLRTSKNLIYIPPLTSYTDTYIRVYNNRKLYPNK